MTKNKYLLIIVYAFILIIILNLYSYISRTLISSKNVLRKNEIKNNINHYKEYIKTNSKYILECFEKRVVTIDDNERKILIGNTKKEIDNGYYDISIDINEEYIKIYINKLFKDFDSKKNIYEDKYVEDIVKNLNKIFDFQFNITDENKLKQLIIKQYVSIRQKYVENVENSQQIILKSFNVLSYVRNNILIIEIRG
ncbi:MAG: hypothetical protein N2749_05720 [Clostridia bacterium]|nr:hypothetical protein [Clostridia bacterium]